MTGNKIGVEGAQSMSEMLKVNTTLTCLGLESDEERKEKGEEKGERMTDNPIGDGGKKIVRVAWGGRGGTLKM